MTHSEHQFEALLEFAYPDYSSQIQGCSLRELEALEELSPAPLPSFYRWFMERFGRDPGPLAHPYTDLRAEAILELYKDQYEGAKPSLEQGFIIGCSTDPMWPDLRYDLRHPARDDARVVMSTIGRETLREMLVWGLFLREFIPRFAQTGRGMATSNVQSVLEDVGDVMADLGFVEPMATGQRTRFFKAQDAVFMFDGDFDTNSVMAFRFGASSATRAREVLGKLTAEVNLELKKLEWEPPLP